jgi:hypothetical protein
MRARIRKAGVTAKGYPLWTPAEDEKVRRLYPDYRALRRALRRRTYHAIRGRVLTLGITNKRHIWTGAEVVRLRKLYFTAARAELHAAFPGLTLRQIVGKARHVKLSRQRRRPSPTGFPILDDIRERAFKLNYSMVDLDAIARTGRYFQTGNWSSNGVNKLAACKAIEALDGEIRASWND